MKQLFERVDGCKRYKVYHRCGIAPTCRIALLDKPTIVWDFRSLLIGL